MKILPVSIIFSCHHHHQNKRSNYQLQTLKYEVCTVLDALYAEQEKMLTATLSVVSKEGGC